MYTDKNDKAKELLKFLRSTVYKVKDTSFNSLNVFLVPHVKSSICLCSFSDNSPTA